MQFPSFFRGLALLAFGIFALSTAQTLRAQDLVTGFGTVALGSNSTETVTLTDLSSTPASFVFTYGIEFSKTSTPSCSGTPVSCSVQVEFAPQKAGWRQDGLLAKDGSGNLLGVGSLYGIGQGQQAILLPGTISTLAGTYVNGGAGGYSTTAINGPNGMAVDSQGKYVYFADQNNDVIRRMDATTGVMTVYAGEFVPDGYGYAIGAYSGDGGQATSARLNNPSAVAFDAAGNLYIVDDSNNVVRKVDPTGIITTIAGEYSRGGTFYGDGGAATSAGFDGPTAVAVDSQDNLYIVDQGNNRIRKVNTAGTINTFAGNGTAGYSGDGGAASSAELYYPVGVVADSSGNIYISEFSNDVRKVTTDGKIHALAGTEGTSGYSGDGGQATSAELSYPTGLAVDAAGNLYMVDEDNSVIREVDTAGVIHTIAGNFSDNAGYSGDGGAPTSAQLNYPQGIAVAPDGNIFIADAGNNLIRGVSYAAPTLSFTATNIGSESSSKSTTVENIGNAAMAFTGLTVSTNFVQTASGGTDCSASTNLAVDGTCEIAIALEPEQGGSITGDVTVTSGAFDIPLDGTGNGPAATPNPTSLAFGNQTVSTTSTAKTVTLTNSGNQSLTISSISIVGTNSADFSQANNCGSSLSANGNCTISVTFTPSATGSRSASLSISDNAAGSPQTVSLTGTGTGTPQISFSPTSWSFGNQVVSTSSTAESITVTNPGNASLTISSISITGTNSGDFSQTNNCSTVAAGSGSCTIQVTFTPSATGSRSASISVSDNASGSPHTVSLSGAGTDPQISFSPSSWSFGNQLINTSSTAESITVTNPGTATLTISAVSITGTNAANFSQTNNCSTVAAGSGSCTIQVTFTPSATGSRSASISVTDNASGSPHTVSLSGTGTAPQISFSPSSWSFGNQSINTSSTAESITLTNPGTATLTISAVSITGTNAADFSQTNNCSTVAAGSGSCTIQVTFTPSATSSRSGSISVTDSASGSPHTVSLSGSGTASQVSFSPSSWSFGTQLINTSSTAESITLTNPGNATLTISSVSITGTNAPDFSQTNNCSTVAAGSGSCTIQVTFTPSATGSRSASISVTDSASGSPHSVSLNGTGAAPQIGFSAASLNFGNQLINSATAAQSITISNPGTAPLSITGITVTGTNAAEFSQTNNCASVAPLASCVVNVTFFPTATGANTAALSITDNISGSPQQIVIAGSGVIGLSLSATSLNFGNQNVLTPGTPQTITVNNSVGPAISTGSIAVTGANAGDFSMWNNCGATLAQAANCTINVTFSPLMAGSRTATLTFGANGLQTTISLSGTGKLTGAFEIVSMPTAKLLEAPNGLAADGALIDQNNLNGNEQQEWLFIPTSDGYYEIQNVLTGKVLDVAGASVASGTLIQEWNYLGGANQQWQLVPIDDVHYTIRNRNSGLVLDVIQASTANGANVQQWKYLGDAQQLWTLVPVVSYNIANSLSSYLLDVPNGLNANGTPLQQWSATGYRQQQWQLVPLGGGYYAIMNRNSGKVLDVMGGSLTGGALIQEWDYLGGANQQWQVVPLNATSYEIVNRQSGYVLDDMGYSTSPGTHIQQWPYQGTSNQQWQITPVTYYNIVNKNSGLVLDVINGATADGTDIQQWSSNGLQQQQWELVQVTPGSYQIMNNLTSKVLDATNGSTADGMRIQQWASDGYPQQQWQLVPAGAGYYAIMNRDSGKALDMTAGRTSNGDLLQQWDYLGGPNQQWQLVPVTSTGN